MPRTSFFLSSDLCYAGKPIVVPKSRHAPSLHIRSGSPGIFIFQTNRTKLTPYAIHIRDLFIHDKALSRRAEDGIDNAAIAYWWMAGEQSNSHLHRRIYNCGFPLSGSVNHSYLASKPQIMLPHVFHLRVIHKKNRLPQISACQAL